MRPGNLSKDELGKRGLTPGDIIACGRVARRGFTYCGLCDERLAKPGLYSDCYGFTVVAAEITATGADEKIR